MSVRTVIYVAHALSAPDRAGMDQNRRNAALWCAWLCRHFDVATVADWIVMSSVLDETPENRKLGLECDIALIPHCSALALVGGRISDGMRVEVGCAERWSKPVIDLTAPGVTEPTDDMLGAIGDLLRPYGIRRTVR